MSLFEKLRLLAEWSPLLTYLQRFAAEPDIHAKSVIGMEGLEWAAGRTEIEWDDELASLLSDILVSEEGEALVRWFLERLMVDNDPAAE
jgi:hypothetical protein